MNGTRETVPAISAPRPEMREAPQSGSWQEISPESGGRREPYPQRVKAGVLPGGAPAVRIFSDAYERNDARKGMLPAAALMILGAAMHLFTSGPIFLAMAIGAVIAGAAWYQYLNWRLSGIVTVSLFPATARVEWRSGWLRRSRDFDRREVSAVRILPKPVSWFPPAMSTTGALATLAIEIGGRVAPVAFLRAPAAEAAGEWLSRELAVPLEIESPESPESAIDPIRVAAILGGNYREVPLGDGWPGTPERLWRHDLTDYTVVVLPRVEKDQHQAIRIIVGGIGGILTTGVLGMLTDSTSRFLVATTLAVVTVCATLLIARLKERFSNGSPPELTMITLTITPTSVKFQVPEDQKAGRDFEFGILGAKLIDAPRAQILLGGREILRKSCDRSVAIHFEGNWIPSDLAALHPATAEAIATILHEQTGMPIYREYG